MERILATITEDDTYLNTSSSKTTLKKSAGLIRPGRKTRRRKCWLTLSFNQSRRMSIDLDFFGRTEEVANKTDSAFVIDKKKGRRLLGVVKVGECEGELSQHLPTTKSSGILRLCHRRNHYAYALAEGVEGCIVGSGGRQWVGRV
jgi:hypothetical protein